MKGPQGQSDVQVPILTEVNCWVKGLHISQIIPTYHDGVDGGNDVVHQKSSKALVNTWLAFTNLVGAAKAHEFPRCVDNIATGVTQHHFLATHP